MVFQPVVKYILKCECLEVLVWSRSSRTRTLGGIRNLWLETNNSLQIPRDLPTASCGQKQIILCRLHLICSQHLLQMSPRSLLCLQQLPWMSAPYPYWLLPQSIRLSTCSLHARPAAQIGLLISLTVGTCSRGITCRSVFIILTLSCTYLRLYLKRQSHCWFHRRYLIFKWQAVKCIAHAWKI